MSYDTDSDDTELGYFNQMADAVQLRLAKEKPKELPKEKPKELQKEIEAKIDAKKAGKWATHNGVWPHYGSPAPDSPYQD